MPNRSKDWQRQAERDLTHARNALEDTDYEWACFAAQQAAEKMIKALILSLGGNPWGHSALRLLREIPPPASPDEEVLRAAAQLDRHYIPARYPNGYDSGIPADYLGEEDAKTAINDAETVFSYAKRHLP